MSRAEMEAAKLKVERARWWAISEQSFYGSLAMRLTDEFLDSVETAQTDGRRIRWNPSYVISLDDEEVRFVLLHETLHCAHQHGWRLTCDDTGNEAGDYEINGVLATIKGIRMPKGGLLDARFNDMACEEIDALLRQPPAQQPESSPSSEQDEDEGDSEGQDESGSGSGSDSADADGGQGDEDEGDQEAGEPDDGEGDSDGSDSAGDADDEGEGDEQGEGSGSGSSAPSKPSSKPNACGSFSAPATDALPGTPEAAKERDDLKDAWERAVMQAAQTAQALGQGALPADLQRELERMRAQRIDWRRELADFVRDQISARNDWSRPARRHAWQRVIYPRKRADELGVIVAGVDTSGSIDARLLSTFIAHIEQAASECHARVLLLFCDATIQSEHWLEPDEQVPLSAAKGGGGTDFRPVFERAQRMVDEGERIAGIVYLTDLYGTEPESIDHPTLWLCTNDKVAATGRTVKIDPNSSITN